jgi:hypothetical protein
MAWGMKLWNMTKIHSFNAAEKHWNETDGWKNELTSWRPLDGKRKPHVRLVKCDDGETYMCVLYDTPIVTYCIDGSVRLSVHPKSSTRDFAWSVAPIGCSPVSHKTHMFWAIDTAEGKEYHRTNRMEIKPTGREGIWTITNPDEPEKEFVLDRKKAAAVRKVLEPYKQWAELTERLTAKPRTLAYDSSPYIQQLLTWPDKVKDFPAIHKEIGAPDRFMYTAYELAGARSKQPVPRTRLPKEMTL